jgi:hypothetical protein
MAAAKTPEKTEELVALKIPRSRTGESEDVFIGLNGKVYLIQRGKEVLVPPGVKEIWENSQSAEDVVADIIDDTKFKDPMIRG